MGSCEADTARFGASNIPWLVNGTTQKVV